MATSGYTDVTVTNNDTLRFTWSVSSQSIANNTTTIAWELQLITDAYGRISSSVAKNWSVTVNGTPYRGTNSVAIGNNTTRTLASGTTVISHDSDGTKSFSYSFSQEFAITFSGTYIGTKTGSGSGTLTTIPRKSSLTVANGTLDTAQTLTVTRQSTSFTHTITYECGTDSGTVCTKSSSTSISFTPPLSLASQNTTGTSVSITYTIETFNGSTSVGSNSYTVTCYIPDKVKPSCSLAVSDATGYASSYNGRYLKGLSKFKITVTSYASHGSAIATNTVTVGGSTYSSASFTTGVINSSGNITITATVTDKRGRTATASVTVTVLDYTPPTIEYLTVHRVNEFGVRNDQGEYVCVEFQGRIAFPSGDYESDPNTMGVQISYSKTVKTEWVNADLDVEFTADGNTGLLGTGSCIFPADSSSSYNVKMEVSDNFNSVYKNTVASTAFTIMHWTASGLGIAFGKIAELDDFFDVGFLARFRKGIVVDSDWVDLKLSTSFKCYEDNTDNQPKYRNVGGVVTITGVVSPITEYTSSTDYVVFASGIPEDLRPSTNQHFVCQGSQMNRWLCTIKTNGDVCISRYGTTAYAVVPTSAWLTFNCTYQIK